jgi:hypothetical protein
MSVDPNIDKEIHEATPIKHPENFKETILENNIINK